MNFSLRKWARTGFSAVGAAMVWATGAAAADDLYRPGITQSLAADRHAGRVGDLVTVVIVQNAQASSSQQNGMQKSSALSATAGTAVTSHSGNLSFSDTYSGAGQIQRSESFVTQMTAVILAVLPNGNFEIGGSEKLHINGETTTVEVRGEVRPADIDGTNQVTSNRIANAQINYNGKGFVSNSAKPGIIQRIFGFLGI